MRLCWFRARFSRPGRATAHRRWGRMLADAQRYILDAAYIGIFPGVGIALTVIGFNLAGDGLRDAFDPAANR